MQDHGVLGREVLLGAGFSPVRNEVAHAWFFEIMGARDR
jgi:hypothetical protein